MINQIAVRARGILRRQEHILFCYNKKQDFYFLPGGTLEKDEHIIQCLQREFLDECQLDIAVGTFVGCLECHWQEDKNRYQEFDMIFDVHIRQGAIPAQIESLEPHVSFAFLPLRSVVDGFYRILPAAVVNFLCGDLPLPGYVFEDQLAT